MNINHTFLCYQILFDMKSFLITLLFFVSSISTFARISIQCDVIYENSNDSWSDYYRTNVDFLTGIELGYIGNRNLYAVIWFSQNNCAVIEMEKNIVTFDKVDIDYMYIYLLSDALNEGMLGKEVNNDSNRSWRIYGLDEHSLLIDPIFNRYPHNSYNEGMRKNIQNGNIYRRARPKEESQYSGLIKGKVVYISPNEYYIIQTERYYVGVKRNTFYYFGGSIDVGDIVYADFHTLGSSSISNKTKNTTHHHIIVQYHSDNFQDCYDWMKSNNE